jgi:hypothetical protein
MDEPVWIDQPLEDLLNLWHAMPVTRRPQALRRLIFQRLIDRAAELLLADESLLESIASL